MMNSWQDFPHARVPVVKARCEDVVRRAYGKTLEVGCNEGFLTKALMEKGLEVVAVDCSDYAIQQSRENFGIEVVKSFGESLPFGDAEFDTVIGAEILEHVENPGKVLAELFRVSKGHVIITIPIGDYWLGELTHLWGLDGAVVGHELAADQVRTFEKHAFVIEFDRRRDKYHEAIQPKKGEKTDENPA